MIIAKIAITIHSSKKMIAKKRIRALRFTISAVKSPMVFPLFLMEIIRAPKSCTAPANIVPPTIQITAGTQPHITPMAGPTIGPVPAIDVKWCPKIISFFVGTKSTPSSNSFEGTLAFGSSA